MDVDDLVFGTNDLKIEDEESSSINGFHGYYANDRSKTSIRTGNFVYFYDFYSENSNRKTSEYSPKTDSSPEMLAKNINKINVDGVAGGQSSRKVSSSNTIRVGSVTPNEVAL